MSCHADRVVVGGEPNALPGPVKEFGFDKVFHGGATQADVYEGFGASLAEAALQGYNTCIFAYGQTGSGKSHSMVGTEAEGEGRGLVPRVLKRLFEGGSTGGDMTVDVSMIEIYNERVYDLLDPTVLRNTGGRHKSRSLRVRVHPKTGAYVENLGVLGAASIGEALRLLELGSKARTIHATNMNAASSRAHTVFTVRLSQTKPGGGSGEGREAVRVTSKVNMVDLAGSERTKATGAAGQRLREGASINKSLSALGKCISALAEEASSGKSKAHVPFRESTLTLMLRESLGGNSRTGMLAAISPSARHLEETLSTLRFASRAKRIVCRAEVNVDPTQRLVSELREEIRMLKQALAQSGGGEDGAMAAQVKQSQRIVKDLEGTWEQRHEATLDSLGEAKRNMRLMGLEGAAEATARDLPSVPGSLQDDARGQIPRLVNLNADPMLSGTLAFCILPGETAVGSDPGECGGSRVLISGLGVAGRHALLRCWPGPGNSFSLTVEPASADASVHVNGSAVAEGEQRGIGHGDRVIFGAYSAFRVDCPGSQEGQPSAARVGVDEVDWGFAFREFSKARVEGLVAEREAELERKYREIFERRLEESNEQIELALGRQCEQIVELQEHLRSREVEGAGRLEERFEELRREHGRIQADLARVGAGEGAVGGGEAVGRAFPELGTPKKRTFRSAQEAKTELVRDIQHRIEEIGESVGSAGGPDPGEVAERELSALLQASLEAMERWHAIRSQELTALDTEADDLKAPAPTEGLSIARGVLDEVLAGICGGSAEGEARTAEETAAEVPEMPEEFLQDLAASLLLVESTNGILGEANAEMKFSLRLASHLPDLSDPAAAQNAHSTDEPAIVVDAYYRGIQVGAMDEREFEERAAAIEQAFTASEHDRSPESRFALHEAILGGLPSETFVGASYVYLKPLVYLMETDGTARVVDEFGNKAGDLMVRLAPEVPEGEGEVSEPEDLVGRGLLVHIESSGFVAASQDLEGLSLFADYSVPRLRCGETEGGEGEREEGRRDRFDIGLMEEGSHTCGHTYLKSHDLGEVTSESLALLERCALRIDVYGSSLGDQAMIQGELDRIRESLGLPAVAVEVTGGSAKELQATLSPFESGDDVTASTESEDEEEEEEDDDEGSEASRRLDYSPESVVEGIPAAGVVAPARAGFSLEASPGRGCKCTIM